MSQFFQLVNVQRWDDHRYYHHCRINQFLHLISAMSFLVAYVFLFIDPVVSALVAWLVSMTTRQIGHFFFEPKGFDDVNQATHEHKEEIKVGYNLQRKIVLLSICAAIPVLAFWMPSYLQWAVPQTYEDTPMRMTAMAWLILGAAGLLFRVLQLWKQDSLMAGLAWGFKIITDPVHDIKMYHKSPIHLLRGQRIDPMDHVKVAHR
ncbi:MAG: hypothetical protein QE279_12735 [Rhodoferax sp.]|jgi:hypothetical protein|nr:hypothetical protein [Rhodoferax sp.]